MDEGRKEVSTSVRCRSGKATMHEKDAPLAESRERARKGEQETRERNPRLGKTRIKKVNESQVPKSMESDLKAWTGKERLWQEWLAAIARKSLAMRPTR